MAAHTRDAVIRGRRIRYVDIGSGHPLVLIHGQGGSWQWWLRNIPFLATRCRVIALDLAGFGESEPIDTDRVFDEQVATVVGLLDLLALSASTIVGHSMGGLIALRVACDHPHRVADLVLVDAGGAYLGRRRLWFIVSAFRAFNAVFSVAWIPRVVTRWRWLRGLLFAVAVHDRRSLSQSLAVEIVPRMASPGFVRSMESAVAAVGEATPEEVSCACLVVWGSSDRILPVATGRLLASRIPDARLVVVENVGHCVMFEAPEHFNRLLAERLSETDQRRTG
ncbi:alpha/beta fold hydrolase [Mycolicibacterium hodleri]|nr:alpha/beta hydrolase [Mycolicibacterium hodleri]